MLCLSVEKLPEGPAWQYELKLDGYRALGLRTERGSQLWSRNQKDFARRFPTVTRALAELPDETVIDGEIVAVDGSGLPSFNRLQNFEGADQTILFYAFDVPILAGQDLRGRPLRDRRAGLRELIALLPDPIRYSESFSASPAELIEAVRLQGLEGVVAKRLDSLYQPGKRSGDWVKMRANRGQELVIGGYVPSATDFDSLLVGYYEGRDLMYAARVRNGFVPASRRAVFPHFAKLRVENCPFRNLPEPGRGRWGEGLTAADMQKCRWLKPHLVAAIEFLEWTPENRLRHPKFVGLRIDKNPKQVTRER